MFRVRNRELEGAGEITVTYQIYTHIFKYIFTYMFMSWGSLTEIYFLTVLEV